MEMTILLSIQKKKALQLNIGYVGKSYDKCFFSKEEIDPKYNKTIWNIHKLLQSFAICLKFAL